MNQQMRFSPRVEERLAGAVMRVMRNFAKRYGREFVMNHVDHRDFADDFAEDMRPMIHRELLRARMEALQVQPAEREREKRKAVMELAQLDEITK
jgi:hypothetical protein